MGWRFVLKRCGDDLFSISVASPPEAQAVAEQLRASGAWLDVVPGIDSVVVRFDSAQTSASAAQHAIDESLAAGVVPLQVPNVLIEIPVVYGGEYGPDHEELCRGIGMTPEEMRLADSNSISARTPTTETCPATSTGRISSARHAVMRRPRVRTGWG